MKITGDWLQAAETQKLFQVFEAEGVQLFFVGGCVRNALIGAAVADLDLCSAATPDEVTRIAGTVGLKVIPTGIEHGTVTVLVQGTPFEITTFRSDVETDGRHATVAFSKDIHEDAARRDFTMNALYADAAGEVIDPLGSGIADALARRLRFVGEPAARIAEDYLRILRYFRFSAWYADPEHGSDPEALAAISEGAEGLGAISRERIGAEMRRLLAAPDPAPALAQMQAAGVLQQVLPGADAKSVAVLVHLEAQSAPEWLTRLVVLGGEDPGSALRLSRAEVKAAEGLTGAMGLTPAEAAYRYGAGVARQAQLALQAVMGQPLPEGLEAQIAAGAEAVFPIRAADLADRFQGPALGQALREREARFIASGFRLSREELL
ncbi:CCA tRNA nucleotidyltransferase [Falsigemmobacter intermedius]|uniref:CCA tRNA nucleotidyltransferase n=1 Tax=Falsigemmobacter intermedius TaxID=1553448 RepID=A0A3S3U815_9RHOB|nr:CCA tRNA nucleotidyltransferase [Falsigemmobacter intermedius]RWY39138.1 CCA tRNA nucleotidyltransferase [Falsigemmobacter intermedius]